MVLAICMYIRYVCFLAGCCNLYCAFVVPFCIMYQYKFMVIITELKFYKVYTLLTFRTKITFFQSQNKS